MPPIEIGEASADGSTELTGSLYSVSDGLRRNADFVEIDVNAAGTVCLPLGAFLPKNVVAFYVNCERIASDSRD